MKDKGYQMADVLLVYPPHRRVLAERTYSPLGLIYLAAVLEGHGFSARVLDFEMEQPDTTALGGILAGENPKVIGINVLSTALPEVYALVGYFKRRSNAVIVVGGSHVTCEPRCVSDLGADYGIRGDGEESFLSLCRLVLRGEGAAESIDGLVARNNGAFSAKPPTLVKDLDAIPLPARHLVRTRDYMFNTVLASRGCPYSCIFCADALPNVRFRSPDKVVDELDIMVRRYCLERVDFADSVFTLDRERTLALCGAIKKRGLKLKWSCLTRCDLVDKELLFAMNDAGCFLILFGVESGVEEIRRKAGKNIYDEKVREAFSMCHELGIRTGASFMFGHPEETLEDMRKTIDFACSLDTTYGVFSMTELMPGTRMFEIAVEEGYATRGLWRDYMNGKVSNLYYTPKGVSFQQVFDIVVEAHRRFYCNMPYVLKRIMEARTGIERGEAVDALKSYCLEKIFPAKKRESSSPALREE